MRSTRPAIPLALAALLTVSCGGDPVGPTMEAVAGTYTATSFVVDGTDVLSAGGDLSLTLGAHGSVAGSLFVPPSVGGGLTADMAGTYTLSGNTLRLEQTADTFVRDATWTWSNGVLDGGWSGSGGSVTVTLARH